MARRQSTVEQLIRRRVADGPDRTWLKWRDEEYSWRATLAAIQRAANGLLELGVRPGERVALMLPNGPEFLWTYFGIGLIGAAPVPVNTSQRGAVLRHVLDDSGATAVVVHAELLAPVLAVRDHLPRLRYVVVAEGTVRPGVATTLDRLLGAADREPDVAVDDENASLAVMYTSGTTGPPKGVVTTRFDLDTMRALVKVMGLEPGQTIYSGLPLFHGNALMGSMLASIIGDGRFALAPRFTASGLLDDCRRYDASVFNAVGGIFTILLKQPPRPDDADNPVRTVLSSGAPADRWHEFEERFGVRLVEWYAMVDSPGSIVNADGRPGAIGRDGLAGVRFAVVDEHDQPVGPGEVGEIVFRHPHGPSSYYDHLPEATADAYRGGWFHSGDLGVREDDGYIVYRGRRTESMRRLGENISAWEIETALNAHPDILECAAHAVPSPLGEDEVKVCVVRRPGADLDAAALVAYAREALARHAVPRFVEFLDALPKTPSQRSQYAALKARGVTPETYDAAGPDAV